jgi:GNAT superfamily N-acetyltransferase
MTATAAWTELGRGDEAELEAFLAARADTSMFLRANLREAGIVDEGKPKQATYVAARRDGAIVAVAAHGWNGVLLLQGAPEPVTVVARAAVDRTRRAVHGLSGPYAQVVAARDALGMRDRSATLDSREDLFALSLDELQVPPQLSDGRWTCRAPTKEDHPELVQWHVAYDVEALGAVDSPDLHQRAQQRVEFNSAKYVLVAEDQRVATSGFNAQLPDIVQVGGVYTPPALRGRGYGRAVVAGSLLDARSRGATRSILFTQVENSAARAAYLALGYRIIGDYGLVLFEV